MAKLLADQRDKKVVGLQEQLEAKRKGKLSVLTIVSVYTYYCPIFSVLYKHGT